MTKEQQQELKMRIAVILQCDIRTALHAARVAAEYVENEKKVRRGEETIRRNADG